MGFALAASGYRAQVPQQSPVVITTITLLMTASPAILHLALWLLSLRFRLNRAVRLLIRSELNARRATAKP